MMFSPGPEEEQGSGFNNTALATIVWGISNIAAGRKINQQQVENA